MTYSTNLGIERMRKAWNETSFHEAIAPYAVSCN